MAKTNREVSKKREEVLGAYFGGGRVAMSGGLAMLPGDAITKDMLFEDKFTKSNFYNLKLQTLEKIRKQASFKHRIPIFRIGYLCDNDRVEGTEFIIIHYHYVYAWDELESTCKTTLNVTTPSFRLTKEYLNSELELNNFTHLRLVLVDKKNTYMVCEYRYFKDNYKYILGLEG